MNVLGLLTSLVEGGSRGSTLGNLASSLTSGQNAKIGGIGALAGSILGASGSRTGAVGGAMGGGALAILGSLALKAFQNHQSGGSESVSPKAQLLSGLREPETEEETAEVDAMLLLILKAMINAAKADGNIDDEEMDNIVGKAKEDGMGDDEQKFIMDEINKPMDTEGLIAAVSDPQIAAQVYTASLLAITVDTDEERDYLKTLAEGLGLTENVVNYLHSSLDA